MAMKKRFQRTNHTNSDYKPLKFLSLDADPNVLFDHNIIGCDETGVGDYLTPLVTAAVYVPAAQVAALHKLGVKDSKQLSKDQIQRLFSQIQPLVKYRVNHLTQKGYNNLNKYLNAHQIKMFLHLKSITQLERLDKVDEDLILIDQFANADNVAKYYDSLMLSSSLKTDEIRKPVVLAPRAESLHVAVACASIIARYHFLEMMKDQEEACGMEFPLGTNAIVEQTALAFCQKFGRKALYEIAKINFQTTQKIDAQLATSKKS